MESAIDQINVEIAVVVVIQKRAAGAEAFRHVIAAVNASFMHEIQFGLFGDLGEETGSGCGGVCMMR